MTTRFHCMYRDEATCTWGVKQEVSNIIVVKGLDLEQAQSIVSHLNALVRTINTLERGEWV